MNTYLSVYAGMVVSRYLSGKGEQARRILFFLWTLFLVVFVGAREWTGCDFSGYLIRFESYRNLFAADALEMSEPGFVLMNVFIHSLGLDYMWLNVLCATIFFYCVSSFAMRHDNAVAILALLFPIFVIQLGMSGLRQGLAIAILLLAWNAFADRKRIATAVWIVIAAQFHSSAIIFIPMVLLVGRQVSAVRILISAAIVAPIAVFLMEDRLDVYQSRYLEGESDAAGAIFRLGIIVITALFFELYRKRFLALIPKYYDLMRAFSLFSMGNIVIFLFSTTAAHRIGYYILPVQILSLSWLPYAMFGPREGLRWEWAPYLLFGAYMAVWFSFSRHANICYLPYDNYLF